MVEEKAVRISKAARELGVSVARIVDTLAEKGFTVENNPNAKISEEQYSLLQVVFESSAALKREASEVAPTWKHGENVVIEAELHGIKKPEDDVDEPIAPSALDFVIQTPVEEPKVEPVKEQVAETKPDPEPEKVEPTKPEGLKVIGKIDLDALKKPSKKDKTHTKKAQETTPAPAPAPETVKEAKPVVEQAPAPVEVPVTAVEIPKEPVSKAQEPPATEPEQTQPLDDTQVDDETIKAKADQLKGLTVKGKIDLQQFKKPEKQPHPNSDAEKRKRQRIKGNFVQVGGSSANFQNRDQGAKTSSDEPLVARTPSNQNQQPGQRGQNQQQGRGGQGNRDRGGNNRGGQGGRDQNQQSFSQKDVKDAVKSTLAKFGGKGKGKKRYKKEGVEDEGEGTESNLIKVTEFCSVSDLASLMDVSANQVISVCFQAGMMVSINQRLDAEAISFIADEFGFEVEFTSAEEETLVTEEVDSEESLVERAPIVTIMGHVDHGKTSLLDYIRKTKVTASEAGGITQHIGAYSVKTDSGRQITFLDTPGHEAFTAMRARGAKVTDVVIIVIAADDNVMPQTKEAINHAQVAGVPIVIALNKIDKSGANPDKIREELAQMNILVEEWGGKYQCQEISAKSGQGVADLLEKVLVESDLLELKANPEKNAIGTVVEASLDKGRGYVTTVLVQAGTLNIGDVILAGPHYGKVKAMTDHVGKRMKEAGPSIPVQILGLAGAPQAGDKFNVMSSEREAREVANKREQILREQSIRTKRHITIDEIGRRIALGNFKELNLIIKGDVDGSVEALADSLLKLSTEEIQIRILHKAVGQISESDVLLASASDAIIIGFQVRPSAGARKIAEQEQIEIKLYSIIYNAIEEVKDAMVGMLAPKVEEVIVGNAEVRDVFKVGKVGTIGGCYVTDGYLKRNNGIRVIRDGIVIHNGQLDSLKRFKDDVGEVKHGYECGLMVKGFNDLEIGDTIESFEEREVKRTL